MNTTLLAAQDVLPLFDLLTASNLQPREPMDPAERAAVYARVFGRQSLRSIEKGVLAYCRDDQNKYWPSPATLLALAKRLEYDERTVPTTNGWNPHAPCDGCGAVLTTWHRSGPRGERPIIHQHHDVTCPTAAASLERRENAAYGYRFLEARG